MLGKIPTLLFSCSLLRTTNHSTSSSPSFLETVSFCFLVLLCAIQSEALVSSLHTHGLWVGGTHNQMLLLRHKKYLRHRGRVVLQPDMLLFAVSFHLYEGMFCYVSPAYIQSEVAQPVPMLWSKWTLPFPPAAENLVRKKRKCLNTSKSLLLPQPAVSKWYGISFGVNRNQSIKSISLLYLVEPWELYPGSSLFQVHRIFTCYNPYGNSNGLHKRHVLSTEVSINVILHLESCGMTVHGTNSGQIHCKM